MPTKEQPFIEVWLSTDMKNTVRVEIPTAMTVKEGKELLARAETYYAYLLEKYGTKQATGAKEYRKKPVKGQSRPVGAKKSNWQTCEKHGKKYDANKYEGCYTCSHPEKVEQVEPDY